MLSLGAKAPDFTGTTDRGESFRLSEYEGRANVVLYFYPKDFTPGCTRQACSFRDHFEEIRETGAVLAGISTDGEDSHRRFSASHTLPFPLIADRGGLIARKYDVLRPFSPLLPMKRITYVVDANGIVRGIVHREVLIGRHVDEVLKVLKLLPPVAGRKI